MSVKLGITGLDGWALMRAKNKQGRFGIFFFTQIEDDTFAFQMLFVSY